jgi:hypothetical protein
MTMELFPFLIVLRSTILHNRVLEFWLHLLLLPAHVHDRRHRLLGIDFIKTAYFLTSLEPWDLVRDGDTDPFGEVGVSTGEIGVRSRDNL